MIYNKKKIILAVSNDLTSDQRLHKVATTLSNNDFEVTLIGRRLPQSTPLAPRAYATKRMNLLFKKNALFYAELNIRLFFLIVFSRYDIVCANDLDTLLGIYWANKIRRKKLVYDSHEYFTEVPELQDNKSAKKVWQTIEQYIFPKLLHCSTVCDSIARIYEEKYGVRVHTIRNLPSCLVQANKSDTNTVPPEIQAIGSKPIILYQGAINKGRGLELLIESMLHIRNAHLLIIGSGDILSQLELQVQELQLEESVSFTGQIPFHNLRLYTRQATIGVSLEEDMGLNYRYALPNKIFDYIHAGLPILVSNLPEMSKIVEENSCGEIVFQRTPQNIANHINTIIQSKEIRERYAANSLAAAPYLCWELEEKKLLYMYNEE